MTTTPNVNHAHVDAGDYYCNCESPIESTTNGMRVCLRCTHYLPSVNKTPPCLHQHVTVYWRLYSRETLYDPAEYTGKAHCNDCGEWMDPEDVSEDAEREDVQE